MDSQPRAHADTILSASIRAVLPDAAVRRALEGCSFPGRVILVAAGAGIIFLWKKNSKTAALVFGILSAVVGISGLLHVTRIFPDFPFLTYGIPAVLSCYFDLFSGFVQAYVFTLLTMVYIAGSLPAPEEAAAA